MKNLLLPLFVVVSFAADPPAGAANRVDGPALSELAQAAPALMAPAGYRDGDYTGDRTDAYYGPMQVRVTVKGGRVVDVQIMDYPHDRSRSQSINRYALPVLIREAIQIQSASVHVISGATPTSRAFGSSLASALRRAKA